jgi:nucleoside-diphosphate kinase
VPASGERKATLLERTLSIIKPDAVAAGEVGDIISRIERAGFRLLALRMRHLNRDQAEAFYGIHRGQPFYEKLCTFMSSGPCVALLLEREDGISALRSLMGTTDPATAAPGTIRKDFAKSTVANAIHGSDAEETARFEIGYFFAGCDLI